jgi:hypothetical protein
MRGVACKCLKREIENGLVVRLERGNIIVNSGGERFYSE